MKKVLNLLLLFITVCFTVVLTSCGVVDTVKEYIIEQVPVISFNEETNDMTVVLQAKNSMSLTNVVKAKATRAKITFTSLKAQEDGTYKSFTLSDVSLKKSSNLANASYIELATPVQEDECGYLLEKEADGGQIVSTFTDNYYEEEYAMKFIVNLAEALSAEEAAFIKEEKFVKLEITLLKGYDVINAHEDFYTYLDVTGAYYKDMVEVGCVIKQGVNETKINVFLGYSLNDLAGYSICDKENVIQATYYLFGEKEINDIYNYVFTEEDLADQEEFTLAGASSIIDKEEGSEEDQKQEELKEEEGSEEDQKQEELKEEESGEDQKQEESTGEESKEEELIEEDAPAACE